jgi:hypothetical protein
MTSRQAKKLLCTAEHLKPVQDGGRDTARNIVASCEVCNKRRHEHHADMSWEEYRSHVRKHVAEGGWHSASFFNVIRSRLTGGTNRAKSPHATAPSGLRDGAYDEDTGGVPA